MPKVTPLDRDKTIREIETDLDHACAEYIAMRRHREPHQGQEAGIVTNELLIHIHLLSQELLRWRLL